MSELKRLFVAASERGNISSECLPLLQDSGLLARIERIFRGRPAEVLESKLLAVTLVPDNSGSIHQAGIEQAVIDGTNNALDVFRDAPNASEIYVQIVYIDGQILMPWTPAAQTVRLNHDNYVARSDTPLYDTTMAVVGANVALAQLMFELGIPVKTSSLVVTDGEDQGSKFKSPDCASLVRSALGSRRRQHLLGAMGVGAKEEMFREMFLDMGIDPNWICLPGDSIEKLIQFYNGFSRSSVSASQGNAQFVTAASTGIAGLLGNQGPNQGTDNSEPPTGPVMDS